MTNDTPPNEAVDTGTSKVRDLAKWLFDDSCAHEGDRFWIIIQTLRALAAERDAAVKERNLMLLEARSWACEAKTQRSTVQEVGSALGGIPDWGPIASTVRAKLAELTALQSANRKRKLRLIQLARSFPFSNTDSQTSMRERNRAILDAFEAAETEKTK